MAILTISDSAAAGTRPDGSGPELARRCLELGWTVAVTEVVADEAAVITKTLQHWADTLKVDCILTTGGTGVAARDVTPEATRSVIERELPGLAELMRMRGLAQTPFAVLSRALAGTRKTTVIINLPGAPKGALFSLATVEDLIPHTVKLLQGDTEHPA